MITKLTKGEILVYNWTNFYLILYKYVLLNRM